MDIKFTTHQYNGLPKSIFCTSKPSFKERLGVLFGQPINVTLETNPERICEFTIGDKIIHISNEIEGNAKVGVVWAVDIFPEKSHKPIISFMTPDAEEFIGMGKILKYSPELVEILEKLTPQERILLFFGVKK